MANTLLRTAAALATAAFVSATAAPASAYQVFFGEDLNNSSNTPLSATPNAVGAEQDFLANLTGTGTEDFDGFRNNQPSPLALTFPGAGGATLTGGNGHIEKVPAGKTNGYGRYGTSGRQFWEVEAGGKGNFTVTFEGPAAAFGFYGVDIGDFGGQLVLQLNDTANTRLTVDNTIGSYGSTDGSVLFFGLVAEDASELFTQVIFETSTGQGDVFAFDDMTVGSLAQVVNPEGPTAVPEPSVIGLLSVGIAGIGLTGRRLRRNA